MKKFRYKFSPLLLVFIILAMLLAVVVTVTNIIQLAQGLVLPDKVLSCAIAIFVATLFLAFLILMLILSNYEITNAKLKTRLGLIVSGVEIKDITQIINFTKANRLSIVFKNEQFSNVVIDKKYFDEFSNQLKKQNPKIIYSLCEE